MKNWEKPLIEILIVVFLCALISELILRSTIGYGTEGRGRFMDGLYIEGEIEYDVNNLDIAGEQWEANFYNLSSIYIRFYNINNELFEETIPTSNLTIVPVASGEYWPGITLKRITNVSKVTTATFTKKNIDIQLTCLNNFLSGVMRNTTEGDRLGFSDTIVITDDKTIDASLSRARFYLSGRTENIQFDVSLSQNYSVVTYTQNSDIISLKGDLKGYNFQGSIWSNGKLITRGNPKLSGEMELKILQNPETYYNHESHEYDWELEIEGEYVVVGGGGYPFWSFGLMLSAIPAVIIVAYHIHKKIINEREGLR